MCRSFWVVGLLLVLADLSGGADQQTQDAGYLPLNVVVFVADDLGAGDIAPYGSREVRTPNLDRLARESLRFTTAFAASPTCAPSRAAMLTGLMPFRNGAHANHTGVRDGVQSLPACLRAAGRRVAIAGKFHIGPQEAFRFERIHGSNVPEPGHAGDGVLWTDLNLEPVERWLADAAQKGDPFVLLVNDHSPHVIWPENAACEPDEMEIPPSHIDTPETRRARSRYCTDITKMDRNVGRLLDSLSEHGLAANTVVIFTADQGPQWPFGKWNLYDYGVRVPLLIRWPGVTTGGASSDVLVSLVDLFPTILEMAGATAPGDIDGRSLVPLLRGATDSIRSEVFATHTGDGEMNRSPARMIRTGQYKLIANLAPDIPFTTHIDRATDHDGGREYWPSWVAHARGSEKSAAVLQRYHRRPSIELYDVNADPHELRNLTGLPGYAEVQKILLDRLSTWRHRQNDFETGPDRAPPPGRSAVAPYIFE